jgi:biopolymer transport protein ExbB
MSAFISFVTADWWIAIPMFLMSIAGITLVIWRLLLNINGTTNLNEFLPAFQQKLDKDGVEAALRYCRNRQDIIPKRLYAAGLDVSKQGLAAVRRSMANAIELEILPDLNFLLPSILAIAKVATMVGLFGTVVSMIKTFNEIQKTAGAGGVASQAGGIGLALFATALGLITAIPLVFSHVLFKAWVAQFEVRMKSAAQKLLLVLQAAKDKPAKPAATGSAASSASSSKGAGEPAITGDKRR